MNSYSPLAMLCLGVLAGQGALAATVTYQANGTVTSLSEKTPPQRPDDIALGKAFIYTFTVDDATTPNSISTAEQGQYDALLASTVQIGNYVTGISLDPLPAYNGVAVTDSTAPGPSVYASDGIAVDQSDRWPSSGYTRQQISLTLIHSGPGGPFDSTSLAAALPKMDQLQTRYLAFRDQNETMPQVGYMTLAETNSFTLTNVASVPKAFDNADALINDTQLLDDASQSFQFTPEMTGTLDMIALHVFRIADRLAPVTSFRILPTASDGSVDFAHAMESFAVRPAYFQQAFPPTADFPPPLIVKSLSNPVLVAGRKYWIYLETPQAIQWRKSSKPMRGYYSSASPLRQRDETVAQPGAFTVQVKAFEVPTAQNDAVVVAVDHSISIDVLANDSAASGQTLDPTSLVFPVHPQHGSVAFNPANGVVIYQPTAGYTGTDTFSYTVRDVRAALSTPATVSIRVQPAPVAANDTGTLSAGQAVTLDVLANDQSNGGTLDAASLVVLGAALHGSTVVANGKIDYTPQAGYSGTDAFQYLVRDNLGTASNPASVSLTIRALPVAANDTASVRAGEVVTVDVLANDTSAGGTIDTASIAITSAPSHGTAVIAGTRITYTAATGYAGADTFQYTVKDDRGARSNAATVSIDVTAPPPPGGGGTPGGGGSPGGGGGGATDVAELLVLAGLTGLALRRRFRQRA
jgi:hypothetical protein